MKPDVDQILGLSAQQLMTQIAPLLPASYSQSTVGLLGIMLGFCAQEFDRAAEIRVAENRDLRELFSELAPLISDAALKAKLRMAALSADPSLKISDLNAANYELRRLLIALQSHVENIEGEMARAGERRIWDVLRASAERRFLKLPGT
jgi:hypothetical protein